MSNGWAGLHRKEALNLKWWSKKKKTHPSGELEKLNSWHVHRAILKAYIFYSFGRARFYYKKTVVSKGSGHRLDNRRTWSTSRMMLIWGEIDYIRITPHSSFLITILDIQSNNAFPLYFETRALNNTKLFPWKEKNGFYSPYWHTKYFCPISIKFSSTQFYENPSNDSWVDIQGVPGGMWNTSGECSLC